MKVTRRNLFLKLLGVLGTGLFARKVLFALTGWKQIEGPGKFCFERVVATKPGWTRSGNNPEYIVQTVEKTWYREGWEYVCLDRAMSTHGEALGNEPVYICNPDFAEVLVVKRGLVQLQPGVDTPQPPICTIGFCPGDGKWYGWSHRAICGFGGGDKIFDERFPGATGHTPFVKHGNITINTWEQAKLAASRFAESIG